MTNRNDIERLFKTHYAHLQRLAIALLHNDDTARDIIHDVFEKILYSTSPDTVGTGYLVQAVRNQCISHLRDLDRRTRIVNLYFEDIEEYDSENWPDEETISSIYTTIKNGLTDQCRRAMELRFVEGLTYAEVANKMGISENAVYRHVRHALVIIRKKLNVNG